MRMIEKFPPAWHATVSSYGRDAIGRVT